MFIFKSQFNIMLNVSDHFCNVYSYATKRVLLFLLPLMTYRIFNLIFDAFKNSTPSFSTRRLIISSLVIGCYWIIGFPSTCYSTHIIINNLIVCLKQKQFNNYHFI